MQIMGETAREFGFDGDYLTELCDPAVSIPLGAKILDRYIEKAGSVEAGLLRWNGGGDKDYPKKVFRHIATGAADGLFLK